MADLLINGKDAFTEWGVRMGDGFLDALWELAPMKEYITNSSTLEDGVQYEKTAPKVNERNVSLVFTIEGDSKSDFVTKKKAFQGVLYGGDVSISVPSDSDNVYHLKYKSGVSYAQNIGRTFCKFSAKFTEPVPTDAGRVEEPEDESIVISDE